MHHEEKHVAGDEVHGDKIGGDKVGGDKIGHDKIGGDQLGSGAQKAGGSITGNTASGEATQTVHPPSPPPANGGINWLKDVFLGNPLVAFATVLSAVIGILGLYYVPQLLAAQNEKKNVADQRPPSSVLESATPHGGH